MAHALQSGLRDGGLRRGGLHAGLGNGSIFNIASLDLNFAKYKNIGSLVTFTRASSGTFVGSDGVLRTAVTNLSLRSEKLDEAGQWSVIGSGATLTATTDVAAPNGAMTAWTLTSSGAAAQIQQAPTGISGATYTGSFYIRRRSGTGTVNIRVSENINTPLVGVTSEWQRFSFTATSTSTTIRLGVNLSGIADAVDLWGAQLEQSTTVGEYIPTTSVINSAPRFDHNPTTGESLGLLVEEARTNNLLQSEDFSSTWTLSNIAVTTNSVVAPDGTTTADTIAPPADGLTTTRFLRQNPILTTQQAYTLSVFVKVGTATTNGINLYVSDSTATNNFRANFNLFTLTTSPGGTGWAAPTATIVPYPNGWYRCILTGVTSTVHVSLRAQIYLSAFNTVPDTYGSIHVWGAQLEAGAFPTSYIPTTTAAATRSADVASITGTAFSSWYQEDEGTWFADFNGTSIASGQFSRIIELNDGTSSNLIRVQQYAANLVRASVSTNGAGQFAADNGSVAVGIRGKVAFGSAFNDAALVTNGASPTVDTAYLTPVGLTQLGIGAPPGGSTSVLNSTIRRITYWPTRLANSTLQSITQ